MAFLDQVPLPSQVTAVVVQAFDTLGSEAACGTVGQLRDDVIQAGLASSAVLPDAPVSGASKDMSLRWCMGMASAWQYQCSSHVFLQPCIARASSWERQGGHFQVIDRSASFEGTAGMERLRARYLQLLHALPPTWLGQPARLRCATRHAPPRRTRQHSRAMKAPGDAAMLHGTQSPAHARMHDRTMYAQHQQEAHQALVYTQVLIIAACWQIPQLDRPAHGLRAQQLSTAKRPLLRCRHIPAGFGGQPAAHGSFTALQPHR